MTPWRSVVEATPAFQLGGSLAQEPEVFGAITDLAASQGDTLVVVDARLARLQVFAGEKYVGTIGGAGPGPEEFQVPYFAAATPSRLAVWDFGKGLVSVFNHEGEYLASFRKSELRPFLREKIDLDGKGNVYTSARPRAGVPGPGGGWLRWWQRGNGASDSLPLPPYRRPVTQVALRRPAWSFSMFVPLSPDVVWTVMRDGTVYVARGDSFVIRRVDETGAASSEIRVPGERRVLASFDGRLEFERVRIQLEGEARSRFAPETHEAVAKRALDLVADDRPKEFPAIVQLYDDTCGRLWVQTVGPRLDQLHFELFWHGQWLGSVEVQGVDGLDGSAQYVLAVGRDMVFLADRDELDVHRVRAFRMRWR